MLTGVTAFDQVEHRTDEVTTTIIAACTLQAIIERRHRNANENSRIPLTYTPKETIKIALSKLELAAAALFDIAAREENRIQIDYDGWLPDTPPTKEWEKNWEGPNIMLRNGRQCTCALHPPLEVPGAATLPNLPHNPQDLLDHLDELLG